jgi:hypothetical protein
MISDDLNKLYHQLCAIEDEGLPASQGDVIYGLLSAFNIESVTHLVQIIRDAQELKEGLIKAHECLDIIDYELKPFKEMVRKAHE